MVFRAVIFDLDGTLLNTLDDLAASVNAALRAAGLPEHAVEAYKTFVGEGMPTLVEKAFPKAALADGGRERFVLSVRSEYGKRWKDSSKPYPGVPELLDELAGRKLPMAVLSNKPHEFTMKSVEALLGRWSFAAIRGALPDRPFKPDPDGALAVARKLGVEPSSVLYLGDTGIDMQTALNAGMHPIGALWGFRGAEELRSAGAKALIKKPTELLDHVQ